MFTTVHFTELKAFAVRGNIERGMRYIECHDSQGYGKGLANRAMAHEILTLSRLVPVLHHWYGEDEPRWDLKYRGLHPHSRGTFDPHKPVTYERFASDSGLVPYHTGWNNDVNYVLDVADLRRKGITVDLTPLDGPPMSESRWDWDYN